MGKTLIIAEIGVNHNGSVRLAKKLIIEAKNAGADCVKFQTYNPDQIVTKWSPKAEYQKKNDLSSGQYEMLKKFELKKKDFLLLKSFCEKKKIEFLSSGFSLDDIEYLRKIKVKRFKIPSGEITNFLYLKKIGSFNKETILSTGMSNVNEIREAIKILIKSGLNKKNLTILHCVSEYPTTLKKLNLKFIPLLEKKFGFKVGFSDHSKSLIAPIVAVSLGAKVIEKHFTLNCNMKGPDHMSSLNPKEFLQMVKFIRDSEISFGLPKKMITQKENSNKRIVRKSIVAKKDILKGQLLTLKNLEFKRPGYGISPMLIKKIIGKKSKKNFKKDDLIKF